MSEFKVQFFNSEVGNAHYSFERPKAIYETSTRYANKSQSYGSWKPNISYNL